MDNPKHHRKRVYAMITNKAITKLLQKSQNTIAERSRTTVRNMLSDVARKVVDEAASITASSRKKTVGSRSVMAAVNIVCPTEIAKCCVTHGTVAVTKFMQSKEKGKYHKKISMRQRCGLIVGPARLRKVFTSKRVSLTAMIFLAGTLEYIATNLLDCAGGIAREFKVNRIRNRHIGLAVFRDHDFSKLLQGTVATSGVIPHIQKELVPHKKRSKSKSG
jgi:hypothetical protein